MKLWVGTIIDINDPKKLGRVQARIFDKHPEDETGIKNKELPWTMVGLPTTSSSLHGNGETHGLRKNSWVMGSFLDDDEQNAVVLFSINGIAANNNNKAFTAETDKLLDTYMNEPDINRVIRKASDHLLTKVNEQNSIKSITLCDGSDNENTPELKEYEHNNTKVIEWLGNIIILSTNDSGKSSILLQTKEGHYVALNELGITLKSLKDVQIIAKENVLLHGKELNVSFENIYIFSKAIIKMKSNTLNIVNQAGEILMNASGYVKTISKTISIKASSTIKLIGSKIFLN